MSKFQTLREDWNRWFDEPLNSRGFRRVSQSEINREHLIQIFKQLFHLSREYPQILGFATAFLRGRQREAIQSFFLRAASTAQDARLILGDLRELGANIRNIAGERPISTTRALIALPYYEISHQHTSGIVGYLSHIEFMYEKIASSWLHPLRHNLAISDNALTFIRSLPEQSLTLTGIFESFVETLLETDIDLSEAIYVQKTTGRLFDACIRESFDEVERPQNWGISNREQVEGSHSPLLQEISAPPTEIRRRQSDRWSFE